MKILKAIFGNSLVIYISFIAILLLLAWLLPDLIIAIGTLYTYAIYGFFIVAVIGLIGYMFFGNKK